MQDDAALIHAELTQVSSRHLLEIPYLGHFQPGRTAGPDTKKGHFAVLAGIIRNISFDISQ